MNSLRNYRAAAKKLRLLAFTSKSEVESFRNKIEQNFCSAVVPNHVECTERNCDGVLCDLLEPEIYSSRRIMIYIHGGSFIGGSRASWRSFCATQAAADSCRIIVPEYRLAPTHAFPSAIEDIQTVFRTVYTEEQVARSLDSDLSPEPEILIGADGAGASIALALVFNLRARYRKCIQQIILFSPWLNLSSDSPALSGKPVNDGVLCSDCLRRCGDLYTFATNLDNPLISPIKASVKNLDDFPPVYIQMGGKEILLGDAERFVEILKDAGVPCTLDVWPEMIHLFQMADEYFPESHLAVEKVGDLVAGRNAGDRAIVAKHQPELEQGLKSEA